MNYIILDLEWNQSPTGKEGGIPSLPFEIIEIGAVKLNAKQEFVDEFHEIIQPQYYTTLDSNVRNIVHLTEEDLKNGKPFSKAIKNFLEWCGEDYLFCTWSPADLVELQRNLAHYKFATLSHKPFFYYDVQKIFAIFFEKEKKTRTLSFAADFFNIKENGEFHSALTDAKYTARIFQKFDLKKCKKYMEIDYYNPPKSKKDEIYVSFSNYSKYISQIYKTKDTLLHTKSVRSSTCCICQSIATKKIDWFSNNSKNYYGLFYCKEHGYLKGKLRIKKDSQNHYFAVKTIKIISKEEALNLKKQKEDIHAKKELRAKNMAENLQNSKN